MRVFCTSSVELWLSSLSVSETFIVFNLNISYLSALSSFDASENILRSLFSAKESIQLNVFSGYGNNIGSVGKLINAIALSDLYPMSITMITF